MITHSSENFDYLMRLQIMYLIVSVMYKHKTVPFGVCVVLQVGYGFLHPSYSYLLIHVSNLPVLAHGRLFIGRNTCHVGKVW